MGGNCNVYLKRHAKSNNVYWVVSIVKYVYAPSCGGDKKGEGSILFTKRGQGANALLGSILYVLPVYYRTFPVF